MKIVAPVSALKEVFPVIDAGGDEIYCGLFSPQWLADYGDIDSSNRRHCRHASIKDYGELAAVVRAAHSRNAKVNLVFNEFYSADQYRMILHQLEEIGRLKIDNLVISDLGLLHIMRKNKNLTGADLTVSLLGSTFSSSALSFYKSFGIKRVVLPREISLSEIRELRDSMPDIELEAVALNCKCKYIEGFCTFQHGFGFIKYAQCAKVLKKMVPSFVSAALSSFLAQRYERHLSRRNFGCCLGYDIIADPQEASGAADYWIGRIKSYFDGFLEGCGACSLQSLEDCGVQFVKIAGRENRLRDKLEDVRFMKRMIESMRLPGDEFQRAAKELYRKFYKRGCSQQYCYYK